MILMPITEPFDQHSDEYERWFIENRYVYLSEIAAIHHFIPPTGLGVEIGVGSGQFTQPLKIPFGIDPSENMFYRLATFYSTEEIISLLEQSEFKNIQTVQTVFGSLAEITAIQPFKNGYGKRGFVVIKSEL